MTDTDDYMETEMQNLYLWVNLSFNLLATYFLSGTSIMSLAFFFFFLSRYG